MIRQLLCWILGHKHEVCCVMGGCKPDRIGCYRCSCAIEYCKHCGKVKR